jgi:penicillin-binding protein 2
MNYLGGDNQGTKDIKGRIWILVAFVALMFTALLLRLWYLQIIKGGYYRELSENNRIRIIDIRPPRGVLYDRNGIPLADNAPNHVITYTPEDAENSPDVKERLAKIIGMTPAEFDELLDKDKDLPPYQPRRVKEDASFSELSEVEANRDVLPGVMVQHELRRRYPYGEFAAHLLGYVGQITTKQREDHQYDGLPPDFLIGQYGVEKAFDNVVRGKPGQRAVEVDAMGRQLRTLYVQEPVPGRNVVLSLDYYAQKAAEEALGDKPGAVVAIEPDTGDVLAMVSKPGFNPNVFSTGPSLAEWKALIDDKQKPMNNRALQGQFPPGSTFKLAMALGGLETGKVKPGTTIFCNGGFRFGNRIFKCWKKEGHGTVNLHKAIVESCDVYFYKLGDSMGIDNIAKYAHYLGLGMKTGIELRENSGLIPSTEWKQRVRHEPWYPGETISCAIGQGYVNVTPIQLARMAATLTNGGVLFQPHTVRAISLPGGDWMPLPPVELGRAPVKKVNLEAVREGMRGVVWEDHGTAHAARSEVAEIGGKTGTAQVISLGKGTGKRFQDHAWFVAVAPIEAPKIAVSVLVEHGGHGGSAAAPIAKAVIEAYLSDHSNTEGTEPNAGTGFNNVTGVRGARHSSKKEGPGHAD